MNRTTTLVLLLLVAALAVAVWWQRGREEAGDFLYTEPLFEDVQPARITRIRIDHLERSAEITLQRDERGEWFMTDPIAHPADSALVRVILEAIVGNRVTLLPAEQDDPAQLGLDPPRIVLKVTEDLAEGPRTQTVEVGELDLDGRRVVVRTRGLLARTRRNLDSVLDRGPHSYRSRSIVPVQPGSVARIERSGSLAYEIAGEVFDLDLSCARTDEAWRMTRPAVGAADPGELMRLAGALAGLQADRFVNDPDPDLVRLGLDPPLFRIDVMTTAGREIGILFGREGGFGEWHCRLAGGADVWVLSSPDALRLARPSADFLDAALLRVLRANVTALVLADATGERRLERVPGRAGRPETWTVSARGADEAAFGPPLPAETARVESILGSLERAGLAFDLERSFEPAEGGERIRVETSDGRILGGDFGRAVTYGGEPGRVWRRLGDEVVGLVGLVGADLVEHARTRPEDLRSLTLFRIEELSLLGLAIEGSTRSRAWRREPDGLWYPEGSEAAVEPAFHGPLERVLFLKARAHLSRADDDALEDAVTVRLTGVEDARYEVRIGRDPAGRVVAEIEGRRSVLKIPELLGELRALLE